MVAAVKNLESHDHPNLFLLGSGTFPTVGTANPTLTIATLVLRAAETIRGTFRPERCEIIPSSIGQYLLHQIFQSPGLNLRLHGFELPF
jgi:choline dehydrogenase-like flavoprotein